MTAKIALMQAMNITSTETILLLLSELAETLIISARDWLYQYCCQKWGTPSDQDGKALPLLILAMGKLGGKELNFSSDVDLIFIYPENGTTQGGKRQLDNAQFFNRLGQRLIKVLDQHTLDGFVYRIDMRLRPFGDSGSLVYTFAALEDYYQEQGRDWERYAMIKARLLGQYEVSQYINTLQSIVRPFVFRRYIDFSVMGSLRNMKRMITAEEQRRNSVDHIKLGEGGIREIEFIVQVFQLIRGGRERDLQQQSLLAILPVLVRVNLLSATQVTVLKDNYLFLRRVENILQAIADQQTHKLPIDELNQQRIAWAMGFEQWADFYQVLHNRQKKVHQLFNELIAKDENESEEEPSIQHFKMVWLSRGNKEDLRQALPTITEEQLTELQVLLSHFHDEINRRTIGIRGREVLDKLMPRLLTEMAAQNVLLTLLSRFIQLLLRIITRTAYLELLLENQIALKRFVHLCSASVMIAEQLMHYPLLLDELLYPGALYQPTSLDQYSQELTLFLLKAPEDSENKEELQLELLRQFKLSQQFRIAAADINGQLSVVEVSEHLTILAEAILQKVIALSWQKLVQRYGSPALLMKKDDASGLIIVGYGKLGGKELGYYSDLDLVFIIDSASDEHTNGAQSISAHHFYLKLAQRVTHMLSTRTASGVLYDVDMRLRPSGKSGLLVSTFDAFQQYQQHEAWTWEHQALVRARVVFGDVALREKFSQLRHQVLCLQRSNNLLQQEIKQMREKMYIHQKKHSSSAVDTIWFDLKHDRGGIQDIEFIAQYLVLRFAHTYPELTADTDNIHLFHAMETAGILPEDDATQLIHIYLLLRNTVHHLSLQRDTNHVSGDQFQTERQCIMALWQHWLN